MNTKVDQMNDRTQEMERTMSDETSNGWTVDTLRIYLLTRLDESDRRYQQRFDSQDAAVRVASNAAIEATEKMLRAMEQRFESVNEFRKTLGDQAQHFVTREAIEEAQKAQRAYQDSVNARFEQINTRLNTREGEIKAGASSKDDNRANIAIIVAVIVGLFQLALFFKSSV